ncbi:cysteine desulfurase NifS [Methanosarcina sp. T3]|uniref:cysteine desulfurase NifS n=1 Tax=Methanosarcina sp. T3 TaxID=3439062 RepID=UPI003F87E615
MKNLNRIYLDNSATTKLNEEVLEEMLPFFSENYGNPSSLHTIGLVANAAIQKARDQIAGLIGAESDEIIFTSGGTESDNLALYGIAYANKKRGNHIITSSIEHPAIRQMCNFLDENGFEVTYIPVDQDGIINPAHIEEAIKEETILISIMTINNEIGTIQPIKEISHIAKDHNVYFHTDAVGAIGQMPIDVKKLDLDILSMDSHKIHGPKGIGAIYLKKNTRIQPQILGGNQEYNLRAGTENVPGIVGMGKAFEIAARDFDKNKDHMMNLRDRLIDGILKIEDVRLNGHPKLRAPNNVNVSFNFINGKSLVSSLNLAGIEVSTGCACTSKSAEASEVLRACGLSTEEANGAIRLTNSKYNTKEEINYVLEILPSIVNKLRQKSLI